MKIGTPAKPISISNRQLLLFFFFIFFSFYTLNAQQQPYDYNVKVSYQLTSQTDSTDNNSINNEYTTLYIGKSQSLFCTDKYLLTDSAMESEFSKGNSLGAPMSFLQGNSTKGQYVIFKNTDKIITYDEASPFLPIPSLYQYTENKTTMHWEILPDTLSIGGIVCQKATTGFGNRKWIAWFASSIPLSEGPYKFCGLPGLILKVSDLNEYWTFTMVSILNTKATVTIHFSNKKAQPLTNKEQFLEKKLYNRDNRFELLKMSGARFSNEVIMRQSFTERAKKDNNWIELLQKTAK